ncbi:hypothetical protein LP419_15750 [Massilia sp. H-1]|nr:hypothetical protein LP419_15750 [Massilia sp. H-1]
MNRTARLFPLLLAGLLAAAAAQARPRLYIGTELSTPSSMQVDGQLTGFATDKVRVIMERAEIDYEIEVLPWKRAFMLAQTQANACIYSTTRIPERETQFKWVGPTHENDWTLFARADRNFRFHEDRRRASLPHRRPAGRRAQRAAAGPGLHRRHGPRQTVQPAQADGQPDRPVGHQHAHRQCHDRREWLERADRAGADLQTHRAIPGLQSGRAGRPDRQDERGAQGHEQRRRIGRYRAQIQLCGQRRPPLASWPCW